jgi:hypothetical protein
MIGSRGKKKITTIIMKKKMNEMNAPRNGLMREDTD